MSHGEDNDIGCLVLFVFVAGLLVLGSLIGFENVNNWFKPESQVITSKIVKVFMHHKYCYSVMISKENSLRTLTYNGNHTGNVMLITDVPKEDQMWIEVSQDKKIEELTDSSSHYNWAKIHIHSADDLSGAGWNHGKNGRGQTEVVE